MKDGAFRKRPPQNPGDETAAAWEGCASAIFLRTKICLVCWGRGGSIGQNTKGTTCRRFRKKMDGRLTVTLTKYLTINMELQECTESTRRRRQQDLVGEFV